MPDTNEYITTKTLTKQIGNITSIDDSDDVKHIDPFMPLARREMIKLIGKEKYDEIKEKEEDDEDRMVLARAESYFALAHIFPHLNRVSSGAGLTKSTGFNESKTELLPENEVRRIVDNYRAEANDLIIDYKLPVDDDNNGAEDTLTAGGLNFIAL